MKKTIKVRLTGKIVEAELLEDREHSVKVRLPDGNVIIRKKPHQVEGK